MSIIYNALKKAQQHRHHTSTISSIIPPSSKIKVYKKSKLIFLPTFLFIIFGAYFILFHRSLETNPASPLNHSYLSAYNPQNTFANRISLALNGIILSNNTKIAVINNQSLHVGETINDLELVDIKKSSVKLKDIKTQQDIILKL